MTVIVIDERVTGGGTLREVQFIAAGRKGRFTQLFLIVFVGPLDQLNAFAGHRCIGFK